MNYLILWLILGCCGYMLALNKNLEQLAERINRLENGDRNQWNTKTDYVRGLAGILLGPFAILLALFID